jgi:hypothetical protein
MNIGYRHDELGGTKRATRQVWRLTMLLLLAVSGVSSAESPPVSVTGGYSPYEREAIAGALATVGAVIDDEPEGKIIEEVIVVSLDPIEQRDPLPTEVNALHSSTKRYVIERQLVVRSGEAYRKVLVDESARRLRTLPQLSLVLCVALRGSQKNRVRLLVIAKDVWSLYVDFDVGAFNTHSGYLLLEPKEANLWGTHQSVLGRVRVDPASLILGTSYRIPNALGRRLWIVADANAVVDRDTDKLDGSYGTFEVVLPLVTTWQQWSWFGATSYRNDTARSFNNDGSVSRDANGARNQWRRHESNIQFALTRSFGWANKQDISLIASVARKRYSPVDNEASSSAYQPHDDLRSSVGIEWHAYTSSFLRTFNLETLGLQEDFRLGHDLIAAVYPSYGSTRNALHTFMTLALAAQETIRLRDGFVRASAAWQFDTDTNSSSDGSIAIGAYFASPQLGFGRLIHANWFSERYQNRRNLKYSIGGTGRLRGHDTMLGDRLLGSNLEYRTPALSCLQLQWGAVAFYDTGMAFDDWKNASPKHSIGFGVRVVIPQVERKGLRLDVAFPVGEPEHLASGAFSVYFTFGQAFDSMPIRGIAPPIAL